MEYLNRPITIYSTIKGKPTPNYITVSKCLDMIRSGRWKSSVEEVMAFVEANPLDTPGKQELKRDKLPVICFAGEFGDRAKVGLIAANGLMILDYDGFVDVETMEGYRKTLQSWPETMAVFRSPSGLGLKVLVKIPVLEPEDSALYEFYFKEFNKKWASKYWDPSSTDISRACYVSSDPDLYLDEYSKVFQPALPEEDDKEEPVTYQNSSDDKTIYERVKAFNRETSYVQGEKNDFIVSLAGHCCEYGVSEGYAIKNIIADFITAPREVSENETRIRSVYRARIANSATFSTITPLPNKTVTSRFKGDAFYELQLDPKADDARYAIIVQTGKLFEWLEVNGFYKLYRTDDGEPIFVHSVDNIVSLSSSSRIKDFMLQYAKTIDLSDYLIIGPDLVEKIIANGAYNNPKYFSSLEDIEIDPLIGDLEKEYLYFRNGILKVTKTGSELVPYVELDKMIWKSSIQDRDFARDVDYSNDFQQFVSNISKGTPKRLESALGFLMSSYKDKTSAKAIILNDKVIDDDPQGGSGKDLFLSAVAQHREVVILNGKNWKSSDAFALQNVSESTHLLVLEDAAQRVKFEDLFPLITGQIHVNAKNKAAFDIPFHLAPKFAITTNYVVQGTSDSHKRRKVDYELEKVYGADYTPSDDFKKRFFDDEWTSDEWNKFDNYAVHCIQIYLNEGIIPPDVSNIAYKQLIAATTETFVEWAEAHLCNTEKFYSNDSRFDYLKCYDIPEINQWNKEELSGKRYGVWAREFAHYKGWTKEPAKDKQIRGFMFLSKAQFKKAL